jgi:AraC-like DNA-binding protein
MDILLFIGAAQGVLLSIVLFSILRRNKTANRILATLLSLFSIMIFFHSLGEMQGTPQDKSSHEHYVSTIFSLFGPLMFYYARALTERGFVLRKKDLVHLLPFAALLTAYVVFISEHMSWISLLNTLLPWLFMAQIITYLFSILNLLVRHQRNIQVSFSSLEHINLRWLYFLTIGQMIIWPMAFLIEISGGGSHQWNIVWLLISALIYAMGYFGLRQPEIFAGQPIEGLLTTSTHKRKYEKSTLSVQDSEIIARKLQELIDTERPYLKSNLSLPDLSKHLSVSTHHISQVLNEKIGKTFFDYINSKRVEEAKRLLKDPKMDHLSIAAIGFDAGFNSLSAFNLVFKKYTNITPSQYRKSNN